MQEALINTLLGMGTVFGSLILISFIIALLLPISGLILGTYSPKKKKVSDSLSVVEDSHDEIVEEVDMASETELVAVITAAIMASYSENNFTPDGLVVRKIRRIKR